MWNRHNWFFFFKDCYIHNSVKSYKIVYDTDNVDCYCERFDLCTMKTDFTLWDVFLPVRRKSVLLSREKIMIVCGQNINSVQKLHMLANLFYFSTCHN